MDFILTNVPETTVYSGTWLVSNISAGGTVAHKFVINGGNWESGGNRTFVLPEGGTNLPVVFFNNVTNAGTGVPVTYQVNLAAQMALGSFNPALGDYVVAAGDFNNWATSFVLSPDPTNATLYTGTQTNLLNAPGSTVNYHYVINALNWETLVGNRGFVLVSSNQVLPAVYYNNIANLGPLEITRANRGFVGLRDKRQ